MAEHRDDPKTDDYFTSLGRIWPSARALDPSFCSDVSRMSAMIADKPYLIILTSWLEDTLPMDPGVIRMNCFPIEYRAASICRSGQSMLWVLHVEKQLLTILRMLTSRLTLSMKTSLFPVSGPLLSPSVALMKARTIHPSNGRGLPWHPTVTEAGKWWRRTSRLLTAFSLHGLCQLWSGLAQPA